MRKLAKDSESWLFSQSCDIRNTSSMNESGNIADYVALKKGKMVRYNNRQLKTALQGKGGKL
jgi:hypothetical protein